MLQLSLTSQRTIRRARLFLTTALISAAVMPQVAAAQMYLNNGSGPDPIETQSGTWNSLSSIWTDEDGNNRGTLSSSEIGILTGDEDQDIDLTITLGFVRAGGLRVESGNYVLRGGELRSALAADSVLAFSVADGLTFEARSNMQGNMTLDGGGQMLITGRATGNMDIAEDGDLRVATNSGRVVGDITNNGRLRIDSQHFGAVVNEGYASLGGQINGDVTNNAGPGAGGVESGLDLRGRVVGRVENNGLMTNVANSRVTDLDNATGARIDIQADTRLAVDNTLENDGRLDVSGTLQADVNNATTGIINMNGGELDGDVANAGNLRGSGYVTGDVTNTGTVTTSANGTLRLGGLTNEGGTVNIVEGQRLRTDSTLQNRGTVTLDGTLQGGLQNGTAGTVAMGQNSEVTGNLSNLGNLTVAGSVANTLTNSGTAQTSGNASVGRLVTTIDGDTEIGSGHTLASGSEAENRGQTTIRGTLDGDLNNSGGTTSLLGGTIDGDVRNSAALNGHGTITGEVNSSGTMALTGDMQVGSLDNSGTANVQTGRTLTAQDQISNSGTMNVGGTVNVTGDGGLTNQNSGNLVLNGATIASDVTNLGQMRVNMDSQIAGDLTNRGSLTMNGNNSDVTLTVDGIFTNSGNVDGTGPNQLTIDANLVALEDGHNVTNVNIIGDLLNRSNLTYNQDSFLNGGLANDTTGRVTVSAQLDMRGNNVTNLGNFNITNDADSNGVLANVNALSNEGTFNIDAGASANAQHVANEADGTMTVGGTLTSVGAVQNRGNLDVSGTVNGGLVNAGTTQLSGGTVNGAVTNGGRLQGNGTLTGNLNNTGSMAMTGSVVGQVANTGTINTNGALSVGGLVNDRMVNIGADGVLQSATDVVNNDTIRVTGRLEAGLQNNASAELALNGGTVAGAVVNAGDITGTGTITGALTNSGTAVMGGAVQGGVTNSGRLESDGALTVASLSNSGTVDVAADSTLTSTAAVQNAAALNVAGNLVADVANAAGATTTMQGGTLTGNVTNAGTLTGQGTISGTVTNDQLLQADGLLQVGNLVNNATTQIGADDTLAASGLITNNAAIDVAGILQGDVLNNGTSLTLNNGELRGNITNQTLLQGAGDILGTVVNNGDMRFQGSVTRLENEGTLDMTGDLNAAEFINRSVVNLEVGDNLTTGSALQNSGSLNIAGNLLGSLNNTATTTMNGGQIAGSVNNSGVLTGAGTVGGTLTNRGRVDAVGTLTVGQMVNNAVLNVTEGGVLSSDATVRNNDRINVVGTLDASLLNAADATATISGGTVQGDIGNLGTLVSQGTILGRVENAGTAEMGGSVTQLANLEGGALDIRGTLSAQSFANAGSTLIGAGDRLRMVPDSASGTPQAVQNMQGGDLAIAGTLAGSVANAGTLRGGGTITGSVLNENRLNWTGHIAGSLVNEGEADLGGSINGALVNQGGTLTTQGELQANGGVRNADGAAMVLASGSTLISERGLLNQAGGDVTLNGVLRGDLLNNGTLNQTGTVDGSVQTSGTATLGGTITGDLIYDGGALALRNGLSIGSDFVLNADYALEAGRGIAANRTLVTPDATLRLGGGLNGQLVNNGTVEVQGAQANVSGLVTNTGTIDMVNNSSTNVLTVGGLAGAGTYALDMNLRTMTSDQIVIEGGAARGSYTLDLNFLERDAPPQIGTRVTLIDIDETFGEQNDFIIAAHTDLPALSERFVYSLDRQGGFGDLELVSQVNPAIGAIFGNVALTQSLIGSVINRPTSPFVTSLAYEDKDKPCGIGSWARVTGGTANASGATDNGVSKVNSDIDASYYGMQVGTDLACFDNRFGGWNIALGALGGINRGDTTQPVYAIDPNNSQSVTGRLTSITKADFDQRYAGLYATATKGRLQADLQYRFERTDFSVENTPVAGAGDGLGLGKTDFSSDSQTISGSLSYGMPIGDQGWAVLPTVGFAWSKMSTDSILFDDGYQLSFEDSTRKIGFVGATVAKTFVQAEQNSALYAFATGTWYKDFADPTISVFGSTTDTQFEPQRLESENLGSYGEVSVGANWIKVLGPQARGRQISASARIDARFGEQLDSVGVSGQFRWQF